MTTVIFACIENAGRSQMAAAFFNALADPTKATAISAGTAPVVRVQPEVVAAMREVDIDISTATPQLLTPDLMAPAQLLVTMDCGRDCPLVLGLRGEDWKVPDPHGQPIERVRVIRDDIRERVTHLLVVEGWKRAGELGRTLRAVSGRDERT